MDIKHSRRLLILGAPNCGSLEVTKALTGSSPAPHDSGSCSGLTHEWDVRTAYYNATVPIWIDEIPNVDEWKSEFLKEEASEVVQAVGAWVFVFRLDADQTAAETTMAALQEVVEAHAGYGADGVMLAVGMPGKEGGGLEKGKRDDWDDVAMQCGFEFVEFGAQGVNEFGEKQGVERVREALEANEWADAGGDDGGLGFDDCEDDEFGGFGREEAEMTAELFGMKASLLGQDEDEAEGYGEALGADISAENQKTQVDDLDRMMSKLLAVREQSADMPEAQRKRMAAQAVRELMGDGPDT